MGTRPRPWRRQPVEDADLVLPGLVHELRQPLSAVDAGMRLVERELGERIADLEGWTIARSQLARVHETLDTYSELLRAGHGEIVTFDVGPVVRSATAQLRDRLQRLGSRFTIVLEPDLPPARGRPHALLHATVNLLANAIDAIDEAGGERRLALRAVRSAARGDRPEVRVSDEAPGIPAERRSRLFEPYATTKVERNGTGIGLALSRRVMRLSGGDVHLAQDGDAQRAPWARTEFVVELAPVPAPTPPPPAGKARRQRAVAAALLAGLVLAAGGTWLKLVRSLDSGVAPSARAVPEAELASVDGRVERFGEGAWAEIPAGTRLAADDVIRTAAGSRATVAIGEGSRIAVADQTQLGVREITAAVQRLRLSRGRISVEHQPDGARVIVVESEAGDAVARASAARFSALATGASLAIATDEGVVRLETPRGRLDVMRGAHAVAFRGAAPAMVTPVPRDVLLKIVRAAREAAKGTCAVVRGQVDPGSELRVDGEPVDAGPDGRFSVPVRRRPGIAFASVVTRDVSGRVVEKRVPCAAAPAARPGMSDFAVKWGAR